VVSSTHSYSTLVDIPSCIRPFSVRNNLVFDKFKDGTWLLYSFCDPAGDRDRHRIADQTPLRPLSMMIVCCGSPPGWKTLQALACS
jgi:hypothetical protein